MPEPATPAPWLRQRLPRPPQWAAILLISGCAPESRTLTLTLDRDATGSTLELTSDAGIWQDIAIEGSAVEVTLDNPGVDTEGDRPVYFRAAIRDEEGRYSGVLKESLLWFGEEHIAFFSNGNGGPGWEVSAAHFESSPERVSADALSVALELIPSLDAGLSGTVQGRASGLRTALVPLETLESGVWPEQLLFDGATTDPWSIAIFGGAPPQSHFVTQAASAETLREITVAWAFPVAYADADGSGDHTSWEPVSRWGGHSSAPGEIGFVYVAPALELADALVATDFGAGTGWHAVIAEDDRIKTVLGAADGAAYLEDHRE